MAHIKAIVSFSSAFFCSRSSLAIGTRIHLRAPLELPALLRLLTIEIATPIDEPVNCPRKLGVCTNEAASLQRAAICGGPESHMLNRSLSGLGSATSTRFPFSPSTWETSKGVSVAPRRRGSSFSTPKNMLSKKETCSIKRKSRSPWARSTTIEVRRRGRSGSCARRSGCSTNIQTPRIVTSKNKKRRG